MKHSPNLYALVALAVLSIVLANAQTKGNGTKRYEKGGLSFDYPDGWDLTENSSEGVLTVRLARTGSLAQIVVSIQDGFPPTCEFESKRKKIAEALIENVATQIHASTNPPIPITTQIDDSEVEGVQLQGVADNRKVTAEVYSARLHQHFVCLTNILAAKDERAKSAWNTVRTTLNMRQGVVTIVGTEGAANSEKSTITAGEVSGHALNLPHPEYPQLARSAHAAGTVEVQVTIDETGDIVAAHAVSGHPLLLAAAVDAAKRARFSVTKLCGEPVRVTGIINYNFVAQ